MRNLRKKTIYIFFLEKQTRYPRMLFLNSGERGNEKIGDLSITREKNLLNFYFIPSHGCVPLEFVFHRDYRVPYRRGMEIRDRRATLLPPRYATPIGQIFTERQILGKQQRNIHPTKRKISFPFTFGFVKIRKD